MAVIILIWVGNGQLCRSNALMTLMTLIKYQKNDEISKQKQPPQKLRQIQQPKHKPKLPLLKLHRAQHTTFRYWDPSIGKLF